MSSNLTAFSEGFNDRLRDDMGNTLSENPYNPDCVAFDEWVSGYHWVDRAEYTEELKEDREFILELDKTLGEIKSPEDYDDFFRKDRIKKS